jgi:hypothetical protein
VNPEIGPGRSARRPRVGRLVGNLDASRSVKDPKADACRI